MPRSPLPDANDVRPLGPGDEQLVADIRNALARHGALDRFGLTLLHEHFALGEDEQLVETCDHDTRTLTTRPRREVELDGLGRIETAWRLDTGEALGVCVVTCVGPSTTHCERREHVNA